MSIRTLISQGLIETDAAATSVNVTVAFAFDSTYLDLFKVAVSSLALSGNFIDAQLAVYTNDAEVFDDPIVRRCADKKVLLSGSRKQVLESLASSSVKRPDRKDWNRGTFLKWQVFEPQDTPVLVFLDVDMIFLRHFEKELLDAADRPLACCPQIIKKQFFAPDTSEIAYGHARALLNHALQGIYQGRLQSNVNSGVMAVSGELLGDAFFEELTAEAASKIEINEQLHITRFFKTRPDLLRMLPYGFNFQAEYMTIFDQNDERRILEKIGVLHFAGANKPWQKNPKISSYYNVALWHWHRSAADRLRFLR